MTRFVALLAALFVASCPRVPAAQTTPAAPLAADLALHVLDVGQGDALLLLVGTGEGRKAVLFDTGPPAGAEAVLAALRQHGVGSIDLLVLSHAHLDHIGGALRVLDEVPVREVLDSGVPHTTRTYRQLLERFIKLREEGKLTYRLARRGMKIPLGPRTTLEVLAPEEPLISGSRSDVNANSVVVRLVHGKLAFLFPGDAERETEERLLGSGADLRAEVLKVPHHGSRHASTSALLTRVRPAFALISCGRGNDYGHPAPETLERLAAVKARILRTDVDGAIALLSDGERIEVPKAGPVAEPKARAPPPRAPGPFLGSRRGEVFHRWACPSAARIREENRVTFESRRAAEEAGRRPHRCVESEP